MAIREKTGGDVIRLGLCGAGQIALTHLRALQRVEGIAPVAISSRTIRSARRLAERFNIPFAYDDHRRVIESPDIDLVLVATPNYLHAPLALAALDAKKYVLVEKPLATSVADGEELVAASRRKNQPLFYAEQLPLAPKSIVAREAARRGDFGKLYSVRQVERHGGPYSPWFFSKETAGGGVLMDLGCHSLSVILDLLPDLPIESVAALTRTFRHTQGDVEDFSIVQLRFAGGIVGIAENNWCHLGGMDSLTEICGDKGNITVDLHKGSGLNVFLEGKDFGEGEKVGGRHFPQWDELLENGYLAQFEAVKAAILRGTPYPQTGEDGLRVLKIMFAAYESAARDGEPLHVDL